MNKIILSIVFVIILIAAGAYGYSYFKDAQKQPVFMAKPTVSNPQPATGQKNAVDKKASSQEQQVEGELNTLDNGNHN